MIHCDHKSRPPHAHVLDKAIDRHCLHGRTSGSIAPDLHFAVCLDCTQRAWEIGEHLRMFERTVESLKYSQAPRCKMAVRPVERPSNLVNYFSEGRCVRGPALSAGSACREKAFLKKAESRCLLAPLACFVSFKWPRPQCQPTMATCQ